MSEEISWLSSEHEARYWWDELENFQIECWREIKKSVSLEELREIFLKVDDFLLVNNVELTVQAVIGAALIKRFIHSRYPKIEPKSRKPIRDLEKY